jgi:hypothetical protein
MPTKRSTHAHHSEGDCGCRVAEFSFYGVVGSTPITVSSLSFGRSTIQQALNLKFEWVWHKQVEVTPDTLQRLC